MCQVYVDILLSSHWKTRMMCRSSFAEHSTWKIFPRILHGKSQKVLEEAGRNDHRIPGQVKDVLLVISWFGVEAWGSYTSVYRLSVSVPSDTGKHVVSMPRSSSSYVLIRKFMVASKRPPLMVLVAPGSAQEGDYLPMTSGQSRPNLMIEFVL